MIRIKELIGVPSLQYHIDNGLTLHENVYRYNSEAFIQLFAEAREAWRDGYITLNEEDEKLLETTDIGEYGDYNGMKVPLDLPMVSPKYNPLFEIGCMIDEMIENEETIDEAMSIDEMIDYELVKELVESIGGTINMENFRQAVEIQNETFDYSGFDMLKASVDYIPEAEYRGKKVQLNKPKRGGSKKYYVYVKNPKTGRVKKISFGDVTGLKTKSGNKKRAKSFAARHNCEKKNDKMKAGYWACRLPRYGLVKGGKWW